MKPISHDLVETTWQEPESWSDTKVAREHEKMSAEQEDLEVFILAYCQDYDEDSRGVALWMFFMVFRMYRKAYGKPIPKIDSKRIVERAKANDKFFESMVDAHDLMLQKVGEAQLNSQPEIWRYVTEALHQEEGDDVELSEEVAGELFVLFKTVVELLDEATAQG